MWKIVAVLVLFWAAVTPPFFTAGRCTAEFEAESTRLAADVAKLGNSNDAVAYWKQRGVPAAKITAEQCLKSKPRFLAACGYGPLVYAKVPVGDNVCRWYRDEAIMVQLQYDEEDMLGRYVAEMKPHKYFKVPFIDQTIYWAD